jgi:hypothetical protein
VWQARGQYHFHDPQAFVIAHLGPPRDLAGGPVAPLAETVVAKTADANAGAQNGAKRWIH